MSDMQNIFTIVKAMLVQCVDSAAYPSNTIIQGYQPPTTGNFIVMLRPSVVKTSISPVNTYQYTTEGDIYTKTSQFLYKNLMQVDFYSDDTKINVYTSGDNADTFHNYLGSNAQEYIDTNYYGAQIGEIETVRNLTELLDKPGYTIRYSQRFELFTHNLYNVNLDYFTNVDVTNRLVETNPPASPLPGEL